MAAERDPKARSAALLGRWLTPPAPDAPAAPLPEAPAPPPEPAARPPEAAARPPESPAPPAPPKALQKPEAPKAEAATKQTEAPKAEAAPEGPKAEAAPAAPEELLAGVTAALLAAYPAQAVDAVLEPLRAAIAAPPDKRDPAKLTPVFENIEDVLEAALIASQASTAGAQNAQDGG
jgi:hypothetical protein